MTPSTLDSSKYVELRQFRRYVRSLFVGFLILFFGVLGSLHVSNYEACESRADGTSSISTTIGGILNRLDTANRIQFEKGYITPEERAQAHQFYLNELERLPTAE